MLKRNVEENYHLNYSGKTEKPALLKTAENSKSK